MPKYTPADRSTDLRTVLNHGGELTDEYNRLQARFESFNDEAPYLTRLVDAVTGDIGQEELDTLRALALAQASAAPTHRAEVTNTVRAAIQRLQAAEIEKVAPANYEHIRASFNDTAQKFTKAHEIVPADTEPALLALAPEKTRKAWVEGQSLKGTLDQLVPALLAAARLAGRTELTNKDTLGLVMSAGGAHRRRVWEAWDTDNRWTALLNLGATITAPTLDGYQPYREPAPLETHYERTPGPISGLKPITIDPEDPADPHAPKRIRNAMANL